jgi:hypothetical protein
VAEELLHGADVVARFEEVGGEAVAQRVAGRGLGDSRLLHRAPDGSLDAAFVKVMASADSFVRIDREVRGRKEPLPSPTRGGVWVLAIEGARKFDARESCRTILLVAAADGLQMLLKARDQSSTEHRAAVFVSLAGADRDFASIEVDVLDPEAEGLQEPEAGSVEQLPDQFGRTFQPKENGSHFFL